MKCLYGFFRLQQTLCILKLREDGFIELGRAIYVGLVLCDPSWNFPVTFRPSRKNQNIHLWESKEKITRYEDLGMWSMLFIGWSGVVVTDEWWVQEKTLFYRKCGTKAWVQFHASSSPLFWTKKGRKIVFQSKSRLKADEEHHWSVLCVLTFCHRYHSPHTDNTHPTLLGHTTYWWKNFWSAYMGPNYFAFHMEPL